MRYDEYRKKMLKVKKVLDFFHRFRYVIIGTISSITIATITIVLTLDLSKGNIMETSDFSISYTYGEKISYSGTAFMGEVSYEFRRANTNDPWTEEEPRYVGTYEARAKSKGNHGYKYSNVSTFSINKKDTPISLKYDKVNYGDDSPELSYTLLAGDTLEKDYTVTYERYDLNETTAYVDISSLKVFDQNKVDVTNCYNFIDEGSPITFNKQKITVHFVEPEEYTYDGTSHRADEHTFVEPVDGTLWYGQELEIDPGIEVSMYGEHPNNHKDKVRVVKDGVDYSANYVIDVDDNTIVINKANVLTFSSNDLEKIYDGDTVGNTEEFKVEQTGNLLPGHYLKIIPTNLDLVNYTNPTNGTEYNSFIVKITDQPDGEGNDCSHFYQDVSSSFGTIKINKREVNIESKSLTFDFDNQERQTDGFIYDINEFAPNQYPVRVPSSVESFKDPRNSPYENNKEQYEIYCDTDNDGEPNTETAPVTDNYTINKKYGLININKGKLKFKFAGQNFDYDGDYHDVYPNNNKVVLTDEEMSTLPTDGHVWECSAEITNTNKQQMKYFSQAGYSADESDVSVTIKVDGEDVTDYFNIDHDPSSSNDDACDVTFEFGESEINKVPLSVTIDDFTPKVYDDITLENTQDITTLVTHSALVGTDNLDVNYLNNSDKNIRDVGDYAVWIVCKVKNGTTDVTSSYDITVNGNDSDRDSINAKINKKAITIHTPTGLSKVYDGTNKMPDIVFDDGPDGEKITCTNKTYYMQSSDCETYQYPFELEDIKISLDNRDVKQNYNITFIPDGQVTITERPMRIWQKEDTSGLGYMFYDDQYHGVYDSPNAEVEWETQASQTSIRGLLTSVGHTIKFTKNNSAKEAGEWYFPDGIPASNAYFGTTIYDSGNNPVTDNYDIEYTTDPFYFHIVKKFITISSHGGQKVFDGNPLDINKDVTADTFYDISTYGENYSYSIIDPINPSNTVSLEPGHVLQVTKTRSSILEQSISAGNYKNDFDCQVIDKNTGENVDRYYDGLDDSNHNCGWLTTYKLTINAYCYFNNKEYDGLEINLPTIETVTEDTKDEGAYIYFYNPYNYPFDKAAFYSNFDVKATFDPYAYENIFMAGDYSFPGQFGLYRKNGAAYSVSSNVELITKVSSYNYNVSKLDLEITSRKFGDKEMRFISYGKLAQGDHLYFGSEEWTLQTGRLIKAWASPCTLSNLSIIHGATGLSVKDCYNITIKNI